jgi:hypothetical protein
LGRRRPDHGEKGFSDWSKIEPIQMISFLCLVESNWFEPSAVLRVIAGISLSHRQTLLMLAGRMWPLWRYKSAIVCLVSNDEQSEKERVTNVFRKVAWTEKSGDFRTNSKIAELLVVFFAYRLTIAQHWVLYSPIF